MYHEIHVIYILPPPKIFGWGIYKIALRHWAGQIIRLGEGWRWCWWSCSGSRISVFTVSDNWVMLL